MPGRETIAQVVHCTRSCRLLWYTRGFQQGAVMGLEDMQKVEVWASQVALVVKNSPANAGGVRDVPSIPGSGRSPGGGHSNPLQYSFLENLMDRGAWRAIVHRVAKSWMRLKQLSTQRWELSLLQEHLACLAGTE